jgi:diadenosine tetraphosphate (Ap4A) HIT family hydrolase
VKASERSAFRAGETPLNKTIEKFGFPATLLREFDHWLVLLRPAQVTLGSLVLASKESASAYSALSDKAFADEALAVRAIERGLAEFVGFERINYLMLMMVDPDVHFHVIPRYCEPRTWGGTEFADAGWPGPPQLASAVSLSDDQIARMGSELTAIFSKH